MPAERIHLSGVLATVTVGLFMGWHNPLIITARTRLQAQAFWDVLVFLLNGIVFVVIGLQLPGILRSLRAESLLHLICVAAAICGVTIAVRLLWVAVGTYLRGRFLPASPGSRDGWREAAVLSWAGMRGVVSLAAAFALPLTLGDGAAFPARDYILFITFAVILTTLVAQGLTLPLVIKRLGVADDGQTDEEERLARVKANQSAIALLDEIAAHENAPGDALQRLRAEYEDRLSQLDACCRNAENSSGEVATPHYQRLQNDALQRERETIIRLRNEHVINDTALRRIQRDLDLAETRLTGG